MDRKHWHHSTPDIHREALSRRTRYNIGKMFTPPKSNSPWEAMTSGSTGGWAKGLQNWGPVANMALSAGANMLLPGSGFLVGAGLGAAGMAGGKTGFQGTDKGWGNVGSTLAGMGLGGLEGAAGSGIAGGIQNMASGGGMYGAANPVYDAASGMWYNPAAAGGVNAGTAFGQGFGAAASSSLGPVKVAWDATKNAFSAMGGGGGGGQAGVNAGTALATGANATEGGGGTMSGMQGLGAALAGGSAITSLLSKQPTFDYQNADQRVANNQSLLQKYFGDAAMQLPAAASEEYLRQIQAPLGSLYPQELDSQWGRLEPMIDKSWDNYDKALNAQYATSGGMGSTDYNKAMANSQALRAQEKSQSYQEIQSNIFQKQVTIKQQALQSAAQQGNFDMNTAMELAQLSGQDQQLQMALESQNYDQFQKIMAQLMFQGFQMANPQQLKMGSVSPISVSLAGGK